MDELHTNFIITSSPTKFVMGVEMYRCSIIILGMETPLSIITFNVTKEVGVLQRQYPKCFLAMMKIIQLKVRC